MLHTQLLFVCMVLSHSGIMCVCDRLVVCIIFYLCTVIYVCEILFLYLFMYFFDVFMGGYGPLLF